VSDTEDESTRRLEIVLAASARPLSLDQLVQWSLARPVEIWRWLGEARQRGIVVEEGGSGSGLFAWRDQARRSEVLASVRSQDLLSLLGASEVVSLLADRAQSAAAAGRVNEAVEVLMALVTVSPGACPGGERAWLKTVVALVRLRRRLYGLDPSLLERALHVAEALGDLRAQAILLGAMGMLAATRPGSEEEVRERFRRSCEAADALADLGVRVEAHTYMAVGLIRNGRFREGIAAFEALLREAPGDLLENPAVFDLMSTTPGSHFAVVALAYASAGQASRAEDLLDRLAAAGRRHGSAALEAVSQVFAAMNRVAGGEVEAARACAEVAHRYWAAAAAVEPLLAWYAASTLAVVRAHEDRLVEARDLLARGFLARGRGGPPTAGAAVVLDLLERLEAAGLAPEGHSSENELAHLLDGPNIFMAGVAHRIRGTRLARSAAAPRDEARQHLERAVLLLREAGALPELVCALRAASELAVAEQRLSDAERLAAEILATSAAIEPPSAERTDAARLATVLMDLGRLADLGDRTQGVWGAIAARLCGALGAERCAIAEATPTPRLLATRGGSESWGAAVLRLVRERPVLGPELLPPLEDGGERTFGQALVVPFAAAGVGCRGWAVLENRRLLPRVRHFDPSLLEVLAVQLGVVVGNAALWQELTAARERLENENRYYREDPPASMKGERMIGDSPALRRVLDLVARVAPSMSAVLVQGDTGVGKELIAREVHRLSSRRDAPFIVAHVAALAPGLVASGLFGHERGAFTGATEQVRGRFELADRGTLFLDEVGELGPEDQVRLLRVLQEGVFERVGGTRPIRSDFRLITATNRDLASEVRSGRFREDLFFRLSAFPIHVPPLRERREEIPTLALFFMGRAARGRGVQFEGIVETDMARLLGYAWPGNVRELEHVIERAVLLSEPPRLRIPPLEGTLLPARFDTPEGGFVTLEEMERRHVRLALQRTRGRVTGTCGAAELLGLKPSTLNFKIGKLGLREELHRLRKEQGRR